MSLKAVHIFFITVSAMLAVVFTVWSAGVYLRDGAAVYIASAIVSLLVAGGLVVYGMVFLRKLKHVGYL